MNYKQAYQMKKQAGIYFEEFGAPLLTPFPGSGHSIGYLAGLAQDLPENGKRAKSGFTSLLLPGWRRNKMLRENTKDFTGKDNRLGLLAHDLSRGLAASATLGLSELGGALAALLTKGRDRAAQEQYEKNTRGTWKELIPGVASYNALKTTGYIHRRQKKEDK